MKILKFLEHQELKEPEGIKESDLNSIKIKLEGRPSSYMAEPKYLGIDKNLQANYYIGATWLLKNENEKIAAVVMPKIERLDYLYMFAVALNVSSFEESAYFSKCYGIDFKEDKIELKGTPNLLTPLIIFHFISLIELLLKKGLKKGYIYREENLKSKIKGKIKISSNIKENILKQRLDKVYCAFNEYTADIPENRLLKKALEFSARYLLKSTVKNQAIEHIIVRLNKCLYSFENVSDNINIRQIKSVATNKIFSYYAEAIKVAKMILRNFDYSIDNVSKENSKTFTFPFWIDMPRLFELYVYSKLCEAYGSQNILFQVKGKKNVADFLKKDERLIIDAKYKPNYENVNNIAIEDIRELSGYARDLKILGNLGIEEEDEIVPKCLIIYPEEVKAAVIEECEEDEENKENKENKLDNNIKKCEEYNSFDNTNPLVKQATNIEGYNKFYILSLKLPTMHEELAK